MNRKYIIAQECLSKGIPFALFVFPDESADMPELFIGSTIDGGVENLDSTNFIDFEGFFFNRFGISKSFSACGIGNGNLSDISSVEDSPKSPFHYDATDKKDYIDQVKAIVNSLDSDSEKTVLSRVETIESNADPIETARSYFFEHENCFRYIKYSPESGLWFGASPELIADYSRSDNTLVTMSLAGTRKCSEGGSKGWDRKNTLEHNIVTDFICRTLSKAGMTVEEPRIKIAEFKNIEHLCHMIYAKGKVSLSELLPSLTPTPAICGWPRERALHQIIDLEFHDRNLYGGIVGVKDKDRSRVYLNLRCSYVENPESDKKKYVLFGGGGITKYSEPETEWAETKMKMDSLVNTIKRIN